MVEQDTLNIPAILTAGFVSIVLTVASILAVQALYNRYSEAELQRKVISVPTVDANSRLAEQEAALARYSWVNREAGIVTIPIERAMELVVNELHARRELRSTENTATNQDPEGR